MHLTQGHNDGTHGVSRIFIILQWINIQSKQTVNWTVRLLEKTPLLVYRDLGC